MFAGNSSQLHLRSTTQCVCLPVHTHGCLGACVCVRVRNEKKRFVTTPKQIEWRRVYCANACVYVYYFSFITFGLMVAPLFRRLDNSSLFFNILFRRVAFLDLSTSFTNKSRLSTDERIFLFIRLNDIAIHHVLTISIVWIILITIPTASDHQSVFFYLNMIIFRFQFVRRCVR